MRELDFCDGPLALVILMEYRVGNRSCEYQWLDVRQTSSNVMVTSVRDRAIGRHRNECFLQSAKE